VGSFSGYNGHFSGSITRGNKTDFLDARGRYYGTTTQQGTASNPLLYTINPMYRIDNYLCRQLL